MAGRLRRERAAALAGALALAATATLAGLVATDRADAGGGGGGLKLSRVGGFDSPVYVEDAPGQPKLLYVVEQPGTVRVVRKGKTLKQPFLNLRDQVRFGGEQGLLSIAFDPGYERNRRFFVYYVNRDGDIRVDMLRRKKRKPTRADLGSRRKVIVVKHPTNDNHNGGQLQFGPDGMLYIGTGDGGSSGDPNGNAQNAGSLLGKLLRVAPRRKGGFSTPNDNPFSGQAGRDEIYSVGLRNPYRFSFDSKTDDLLIGDVGQDEWEEIDRVSFANVRGANFGWDLFEGTHEFEGNSSSPPANYRPPIHEYSSAGSGNCSITGGYVARDRSVPALAGRYLYADFCNGDIRSLDPRAPNPSATDSATGLRVDSPSSFGEGARGRLYVASLEGPVFRIGR
jgi:glucose/arabinose dehydrogenase